MEKEKKVRQKINWKKEMKLAPGYIVIILWVIFTFMLLDGFLQRVFRQQLIFSQEKH